VTSELNVSQLPVTSDLLEDIFNWNTKSAEKTELSKLITNMSQSENTSSSSSNTDSTVVNVFLQNLANDIQVESEAYEYTLTEEPLEFYTFYEPCSAAGSCDSSPGSSCTGSQVIHCQAEVHNIQQERCTPANHTHTSTPHQLPTSIVLSSHVHLCYCFHYRKTVTLQTTL